jgi:PPP family 3-phenylpropionic acid transporter
VYYFASFAALGAYAPYFPTWLEAHGVQGVAMGLVAGLLPAMGVLGPPVIGLLADSFGVRGSILRVACLGASVSMASLAFLAMAGAPPFVVIFALVIAYAAFRSPLVMLADVVALERASAAGTTYGELRLWGSLGFLLAAFTVGHLIDPRRGAPLPAVVAGLLLLAFVAATRLPSRAAPLGLPVAGGAADLARAPAFAVFLVVSVLAQVAHASYDLCFALHVRDLGAPSSTAGALWALGVVFEIALMAAADRLLAVASPPSLLAVALAGAAMRWALLASVRSVPMLAALAPLHALSFAMWWVASLAYVKQRAPAQMLATAQGLFSAAVAAGSVVGMIAWGALYRHAGGAGVFELAALVAAVAAAIAYVWAPRAWAPGASAPEASIASDVVPSEPKTFAPPGSAG